ncbi:hypothetical protein DFS34DRAFT_594555 [Phlyctochytrium arcticum]|nr:hypothetical protein DFS34DRAFT_594555 [Phlyctochytrium arcticum]
MAGLAGTVEGAAATNSASQNNPCADIQAVLIFFAVFIPSLDISVLVEAVYAQILEGNYKPVDIIEASNLASANSARIKLDAALRQLETHFQDTANSTKPAASPSGSQALEIGVKGELDEIKTASVNKRAREDTPATPTPPKKSKVCEDGLERVKRTSVQGLSAGYGEYRFKDLDIGEKLRTLASSDGLINLESDLDVYMWVPLTA